MGALLLRTSLVAALVLGHVALGGAQPSPRQADPLPTAPVASSPEKADVPEWFVQVWFEEGLPALATDGEDLGRVEVTIDGRFVACQTASSHRDSWDRTYVVVSALGVVARGRQETIRVETYGELARMSRPRVKISPMPKTLAP